MNLLKTIKNRDMKRILEVQKEIGVLSKSSKNPFFKSQYLDLNSLLNEIKPLLESKGLILMQPIKGNEVYSMILDSETGLSLMDSYMSIPSNLTDPQKIGSCITYFRRYTLKSLLSIAETDDDANLASKPVKKKEEKKVLDAAGVAYLKDNIDQIPGALKTREMTSDQRTYLTSLIK